ncbi:MAG: lipoate--protein ligase [Bacillota bacterium]|nr:lipoate--protein ligase [Bacillota bacterium]
MKFVESHSYDPEYNLAFEEFLFKYLPLDNGEEYVYLWQNADAVIIGKNQNAWAEINEQYMDDTKTKLVRRITGGGAVYHDLGNLNFSFITKDKGQGKIDFSTYYVPIVEALKKLGVPAELSGRNDISVDGKKVVGASQSIWKNRVLSNGCMLFDVKMENLAQALKVRPEKLKTKGIASVKARVSNIKPYMDSDKTVEDFKALLLKELFDQVGQEVEEYVLSEEDLKKVEEIKAERFGNSKWNWGKSPKGSYSRGIKFPAAWVETSFDVNRGKLENVKILGDYFGTMDTKEIEEALEGQDYKKDLVENVLKGFQLEKYFGKGIDSEDLVKLFFQED